MGVWYDAVCLFGIEYSYDEICHIKQKFTDIAEKIGCNELPNLLSEIYYNNFVTFINNDNYKDEESQSYYLGIELTQQRLYTHPNYELYNKKIEEECKKLGIIYKIPQIHNIVVLS